MKRFISIALLVCMVLALAVPAMAAALPQTATVIGIGFHCDANGGNGSVKIPGTDNKTVVNLTRIDDGRTWKVDCEAYVCPKCGSNLWASFSNKSGVPNGKNIQVSHYRPVEEPPVVITECEYVMLPYFLYGTLVWNATLIAQDNAALLAVHGAHAAALAANGYEVRAGEGMVNPVCTCGEGHDFDAQVSGWVKKDYYYANVAEFGAFWEYWGQQYQNVFEQNCY